MAGSGIEGVIISGHEDRFIRFFDANSGKFLVDAPRLSDATNLPRSMHVQHARASGFHLKPVSQPRQPRAGQRRSRCQFALLVA